MSEITELTAEERAAYIEDINHVAEALHQAFHPQKVNYGAYGDTGHHLHFHLVPKYTDEYEWGGVFAMNPQQKFVCVRQSLDFMKPRQTAKVCLGLLLYSYFLTYCR